MFNIRGLKHFKGQCFVRRRSLVITFDWLISLSRKFSSVGAKTSLNYDRANNRAGWSYHLNIMVISTMYLMKVYLKFQLYIMIHSYYDSLIANRRVIFPRPVNLLIIFTLNTWFQLQAIFPVTEHFFIYKYMRYLLITQYLKKSGSGLPPMTDLISSPFNAVNFFQQVNANSQKD